MVALAKVSQAHVNFRGLHQCSLCKASGGDENPLHDSNINLIVPSVSVVYVAPAGITHYIRHHSYQPPNDFAAAIDGCPEYGTSAFFQALRAANHGRKIPLQSMEEEYRATQVILSKAVEARQQRRP